MSDQVNDREDLKNVFHSFPGPSVAIAYEGHASEHSSTKFRCAPFYCSPSRDADTGKAFNLCFNRKTRRFQSAPNVDRYPPVETLEVQEETTDRPHNLGRSDGQDVVPVPLDTSKLPVEMFDHIAEYLSRDDVKNMRLACKDFERFISGHFFRSVVVPFHPGIYGTAHTPACSEDRKGKGRKTEPTYERATKIMLAMAPSMAHGDSNQKLNVYRDFGPFIQRYGMSFEVSDDELKRPQAKNVKQGHDAYWGAYDWPFPEYPRFPDRAGLEEAADETSAMKQAFSQLPNVNSLALSVTSGLGWITNGDLSLRSRILRSSDSRCESSRYKAGHLAQARRKLWQALEDGYRLMGAKAELKLSELGRLETDDLARYLKQAHAPHWMPIEDGLLVGADLSDDFHSKARNPVNIRVHLRSYLDESYSQELYGYLSDLARLHNCSIEAAKQLAFSHETQPEDSWKLGAEPSRCFSELSKNTPTRFIRKTSITDNLTDPPGSGILYTKPFASTYEGVGGRPPGYIIPNALSQAQKEWLMETAWAQDAFLSSYLLSVADNSLAFEQVQTLTLAPFSSRHLAKLHRNDFWSALPRLKALEIIVLPDWRDVCRNYAGETVTPNVRPSEGADALFCLLNKTLRQKTSLAELKVGWASGGEHAEGFHARDNHLLPAPIVAKEDCLSPPDHGLKLLSMPKLTKLVLVNCWVTPNALTAFTTNHLQSQYSLSDMIFDSVSLTAHPKYPAQNQGAHATTHPQGPPVATHLQGPGLSQPTFQHGWSLRSVPMPATLSYQQQQQHSLYAGNHAAASHPFNHAYSPVPPNLQVQQVKESYRPRDGSWPNIFSVLGSACSRSSKDKRLRLTMLSCGYARFPHAAFSQSCLDEVVQEQGAFHGSRAPGPDSDPWLSKRRDAVGEYVLQSSDPLLGYIFSLMKPSELSVLEADWGLERGWPKPHVVGGGYDDDDGWGRWGWRTAEGKEYDGHRIGGMGRFSGRITLPRAEETHA